MMASLQEFFSVWELFESSIYASVLVSISLSLVGIIALSQHMVFLTAALSQSAALGIAFGFLLHTFGLEIPPLLAAFLLTSVLTFASQHINQKHHMMGDTALGLTFLFSQAALLLIAPYIVGELSDINTLLFGSAVSSTEEDMYGALGILMVTVGIFVVLFPAIRGFLISPTALQVRGVPITLISTVIAVLMSLNVTFSTPIVGALTVFAFTICPAFIASRLVVGFARSLICSAIVAALSAFVGFVLSYVFDSPVGPTQVVVLLLVLILSFVPKH